MEAKVRASFEEEVRAQVLQEVRAGQDCLKTRHHKQEVRHKTEDFR